MQRSLQYLFVISLLSTACTTTTAQLNYGQLGVFSDSNVGNHEYKEIGPVSTETNGWLWTECDKLTRRAVRELLAKSKARGGNTVYDIRFKTAAGKRVSEPSCVQEWGWFAAVYTIPYYALPFAQDVNAYGMAGLIENWEGPEPGQAPAQPPVITTAAVTQAPVQPAPSPRPIAPARLKNPGVKCASLPIKALGVSGDMAKLLDEIILGELADAGFEAIGSDDMDAMLGLNAMKDAVGCGDTVCMVELGGALGVDYLISGKIGTLDTIHLLTIKLIDVKNSKVLGRANGQSEKASGLTAVARELVSKVVRQSGL